MRHFPYRTVLCDVDGTLIDSNHAHAHSWMRALGHYGVAVDVEQIRPLIGMGADKLLRAVADTDASSPLGKAIGAEKQAQFVALLPTLRATSGARALLEHFRGRGMALVVATSASDEEMSSLLKCAGVDDLFATRASKDDAADSKPDPDIVIAALRKGDTDPAEAVMVGDTPYDIEAAARAGVVCVAVRCGGYWQDSDFHGAIAIYDDPAEMLYALTRGTK